MTLSYVRQKSCKAQCEDALHQRIVSVYDPWLSYRLIFQASNAHVEHGALNCTLRNLLPHFIEARYSGVSTINLNLHGSWALICDQDDGSSCLLTPTQNGPRIKTSIVFNGNLKLLTPRRPSSP